MTDHTVKHSVQSLQKSSDCETVYKIETLFVLQFMLIIALLPPALSRAGEQFCYGHWERARKRRYSN